MEQPIKTPPPVPKPQVVKITLEEANSSHVDDLLQRQASMRGERGMAAPRGRRSFLYQNWFIFMLAAGAAAFAAWAMIEPYFDDNFYFQGPLEFVKTAQPPPVNSPGRWVKVNGQEIFLLDEALTPKSGEEITLKAGDNVGIHAAIPRHFEDHPPEKGLPPIYGFHLVVDPPAKDGAKGSQNLEQQEARNHAAGMLLLPLTAAMIGLALGAVDGIVCRLPRRALLGGGVGLLTGFIGGFVFSFVAGLAYKPIADAAASQMAAAHRITPFAFTVQLLGRTLAWTLVGMAMGLGQGIALRSKRLLMYGFIGGVIGGLLGGLLFDPLHLLLVGEHAPSAHLSRMISLTVIGLAVGAMIGVVELLARDAWLRMVEGPLAGKEFLLFKDAMKIGASPRCDIYLFNDPLVADVHATLRSVGDHCEIENEHRPNPILINGRPATLSRLRHGDQIAIGRTVFVFERRQGA
jgi:hypothetical protein